MSESDSSNQYVERVECVLASGVLPHCVGMKEVESPSRERAPLAFQKCICKFVLVCCYFPRQLQYDVPRAGLAGSRRTIILLSTAMAVSSATWSEYRLCHGAEMESSPSMSMARGHSVIVVPELITPSECSTLVAAAKGAARQEEPAPRLRLPIDEKLHPDEQQRAHEVLNRALRLVEAELPELATLLFGQSIDLCGMEKMYATYEPALNIYEVGGDFEPHRDKHSLSVLIPLTPPDSFSGGGTAFWPEEMCAGRRVRRGYDGQAHLLRPAAGTCMLFCGELMHAARPVTGGTRVVLVASMTARAFRFGVAQ